MITEKITYRIFGIPIWSVEKRVNVDELYDIIAKRLSKEMSEAFDAQG